jgi:high-affinity nickel-transport protein
VLSILLLGFLLGMRHATDPDHVVAVTTIVVRERRLWTSSLIGALWGLGHTATLLFVGGAIVLFEVVIPARVGLGLEFTVAIMLVVLGAMNLSGAVVRLHRRDPVQHDSGSPFERRPRGRTAPRSLIRWRPLLIGVVHGLAGSAAVALLVLATIHDARWGLAYLIVFGVGTIAGMMVLTTALGLPFSFASRRVDRIQGWLAGASGLASVAFGAFLAYDFVFVRGLLSAAPHWIPR